MKRLILLLLFSCVFAACKKKKEYPAQRILILGNSVTYSNPNSAIDWKGNWGMAATTAENDYVHLFTNEIKKLNGDSDVRVKNITHFETSFDTYNLEENLQDELTYNPDLLIIRIGENVIRTGEEALFDQKYKGLVNYFKAKNPSLKVLAVGSVWPFRDFASNIMKKYSPFISLDFLSFDTSNYAFGQFSHYGVQTHPSNKGMAAIADLLSLKVKPILYPDNY